MSKSFKDFKRKNSSHRELVECPQAYQSSCKEAWTPVRKIFKFKYREKEEEHKRENEYTR